MVLSNCGLFPPADRHLLTKAVIDSQADCSFKHEAVHSELPEARRNVSDPRVHLKLGSSGLMFYEFFLLCFPRKAEVDWRGQPNEKGQPSSASVAGRSHGLVAHVGSLSALLCVGVGRAVCWPVV